jgi:hypothetical protein
MLHGLEIVVILGDLLGAWMLSQKRAGGFLVLLVSWLLWGVWCLFKDGPFFFLAAFVQAYLSYRAYLAWRSQGE